MWVKYSIICAIVGILGCEAGSEEDEENFTRCELAQNHLDDMGCDREIPRYDDSLQEHYTTTWADMCDPSWDPYTEGHDWLEEGIDCILESDTCEESDVCVGATPYK